VWTGPLLLTQRRTGSGEGKRHDPTRFEAKNLQVARQVPSKMGSRATICVVEFTHHTVPSHGIHTLLHGAWLRGGLAHGHRLR
jgi:hypothetical protein